MTLSPTLMKRRNAYYAELDKASQALDITPWLIWFAEATLAAQSATVALVHSVLAKSRMLAGLAGRLNARQEKALLRLFEAGIDGFEGGLRASNYTSITGASPATTTRDLAELVALGALTRTGEFKHARYWLKL